MCGIIGWCNFYKRPNLEILDDLSKYLENRGPDNHGEFSNQNLAFVHKRLSIIDLSEISNQPMIDSETRNVLVFNGEIYNFLELKKEIIELTSNKNIFKSKGDTEVILIGYKVFGIDKLLSKLEGMFAFAIWDDGKKVLYLARDRLGEKPLYYSSDSNKGIIFSSNVKSIISHPQLKNKVKIDISSIDQYLSFNYLLFEKTFFSGIKSLEPGSYISFDKNNNSNILQKKYWNLENCFRNKQIKKLSFIEAKKKLSLLLKNSIKSRIFSDVNVGTYLSGGIDSSLISLKLKSINNHDMDAHNISFKEKKFDEKKYAEYLSRKIDANLKVYEMPDPKTISLDFHNIVESMDQPMADTAFISNFYLSKFSSKYSKVVLSGDGADEMLCGYETYLADFYKKLFNNVPVILSSVIRKILYLINQTNSDQKVSFNYKIKKFFENFKKDEKEAHIMWRSIFNFEEKKNLFSNSYENPNFFKKIFEKYNIVKDLHYLDQHMYIDLITWFPNDILYKVDRTTMHHSQEGRIPLLDTELIEFCCSLPIKYKLNFFKKKYIFKEMLNDELGKKYLNRKKSGFNSPVGAWIINNTSFKDLTYSLVTNERLNSFFKKSELIRYFNEHIKGKEDNTYKLFTLMVLSQWMNNNKINF